MAKREQEKDILAEAFDNKPKVKASQEAKEKSLLAFQNGLKENKFLQEKEKRFKFKKHVIGFSSTIAAAGIVSILAFGMFGGPSPEDIRNQGIEEREESRQETEQTMFDKQELSNILNDIWKRHPLGIEETVNFQRGGISKLALMTHIPGDWQVKDSEDEDMFSMHSTGPAGEEMNLYLFKKDESEAFDQLIQEITTNHAQAEEIPINTKHFVEELKANRLFSSYYDDYFPFEVTNAKMIAFIDKKNETYSDFITSELFGYPMIFTSELPLDNIDSWNLPIHFFTEMHALEPLIVRGSQGEDHPEYDRPMEQTVLVPIGATFLPHIVEMELYANEELQLTSYLPKNTEIQKNEHEYFTEWRFTNPEISKNSFYSFGKLKDGFPLEKGQEIMFDTFGIDSDFSPPEMDASSNIPYIYPYSSANASGDSDISIGGQIELLEINGEWYYKHKHADWQEYNGGYLSTRLEYFINSIEWH